MKLSYECELKWDDLKGDSPRRRYCLDCNQHVYNISAMTKREARELINAHQGPLCVRLKPATAPSSTPTTPPVSSPARSTAPVASLWRLR